MSVVPLDAVLMARTYGGIIVAPGIAPGALVTKPGQIQYGEMLLGGGTTARWKQLTGWRDLPAAQVADSPRPQAHGSYPGSVYGDSITVTLDYLLRGSYEDKVAALAAIEQYAPMDGVERALVVNDGDGAWYRMARVTARSVPQDQNFRQGPLSCSMQFLCADPRRYSLTSNSVQVTIPTSVGGLNYPLNYPLDYGSFTGGGAQVNNGGAVATPIVATFRGPLTNPVLTATDHITWQLGFGLSLAAGETLVVDTSEGTVLLNGTADRLYTITAQSDPLERCVINPGAMNLSLLAEAGNGSVTVTYHDARM